jgi:enolase
MPIPSFNVLNGGEHAGNTLAFQEFMIMPVGADNFREAMQMGTEIYHILKRLIKQKFGAVGTLIGDEGGFAPNIKDEHEAL